jgi:hypothetical protein
MVDATWSFPQSLVRCPYLHYRDTNLGCHEHLPVYRTSNMGANRADSSSLTAIAKEPYNGRYREVIVLHWTTSYSVDCFAAGLVEGDDPPHEEAGILSKGQ